MVHGLSVYLYLSLRVWCSFFLRMKEKVVTREVFISKGIRTILRGFGEYKVRLSGDLLYLFELYGLVAGSFDCTFLGTLSERSRTLTQAICFSGFSLLLNEAAERNNPNPHFHTRVWGRYPRKILGPHGVEQG